MMIANKNEEKNATIIMSVFYSNALTRINELVYTFRNGLTHSVENIIIICIWFFI